MAKPRFFPLAEEPSLADLCEWTGAKLGEGVDPGTRIRDVAPLDAAGPGDLTFLDNSKYLSQFAETRAAAAFVSPRFASRAPAGCGVLIAAQPYRAMAETMIRLFPSAARPASGFAESGVSARAHVHPEARLEPGVVVDPGAVIGPRAYIGAGAVIGANAVIGPDVCIGRGSTVGPNASVQCALIGDRVLLHPGVRIGQDGFGFALGARGHLKVPQVGRVIIQDDVEIGANSTVDRGANRDTIIGEGSKIDNLVQIGHNVVMGRHCVLVSQSGVSGSCVLGDFVALGGQAGLAGHLRVGSGAQIAAAAGVMNDIPAGETWGGAPAQRLKDFFREVAAVKKLVRNAAAAREASAD